MFHLLWLFSLTTLGATATAGALPRKQGDAYLNVEFSSYQTSRFWDMDGNSQSLVGEFDKQELVVYGEYGLTNTTTLTYRLAHAQLEQGPFSNNGLTAPEIGLIHNLYRNGPYAFSVYGKAVLPNGQSPTSHFPPIDYNQTALEAGVLYGGYFDKGYFDAGLGLRAYKGYPSNQARGYFRSGYRTSPAVSLWGQVELTLGLDSNAQGPALETALGNQVSQFFSGAPGTVTTQPFYKLGQLSFGADITLSSCSVITPFVRIPVWGRNTGQGRTLGLQLSFNF
jgi:hypothetical protein